MDVRNSAMIRPTLLLILLTLVLSVSQFATAQ